MDFSERAKVVMIAWRHDFIDICPGLGERRRIAGGVDFAFAGLYLRLHLHASQLWNKHRNIELAERLGGKIRFWDETGLRSMDRF